MARPLTAAIQAEIVKQSPHPVFLIDLDMPSGAIRRSTHDYDLTHEGNVYTGGADFLDVGPIEETIDLIAAGQRIMLSGSPASLISTFQTDKFQGRDMNLWLGFLDSNGALIADTVPMFKGLLDTVEAVEGGKEAIIVVTGENRLVDMNRGRERQYTPEDQKQQYPSDKGLDFVSGMQEKDIRWAGGLLPSLLRQGRVGGLFGIKLASVANEWNMNTVSIREPTASRRFMMGQSRVGMIVLFAHRVGLDNLHVVGGFCDGPINEIGDIYFNDKKVPLDSAGKALNTTYTATTISAAASDDSFNDSAGGFPLLFKDDKIQVDGFTGFPFHLIRYYRVKTATSSKITVNFALADRSAGPSVKITDLSGYEGSVTIKKHLGDPTQVVDADLNAAIPAIWTTDHRLQSIAYIYLDIIMDEDRFADGLPNITAVLKGMEVRDGRTNTHGYTPNAALLLNAYLGDRELGLGEANITDDGLITEAVDSTQDDGLITDPVTTTRDDGLITDTVFRTSDAGINTAADVCDEQVPLAGGGNENRYEVNAVVERTMPPSHVIDELLACMAGKLVYTGGVWQLLAGKYVAPTLTFDEDDMLEDIRWTVGRPRRDLVNGVRGQFISPDHIWRQVDYPFYVSTVDRADDGGESLWRPMDRPMIISSATCQRLGKIDVKRSHQGVTAELILKLKALEVRAGDLIKVTYARLNWTDKEFEVERFRMILTGVPSMIKIVLNVRETVSSIFDWTTGEEKAMSQPSEPDLQPLSMRMRLTRVSNIERGTGSLVDAPNIEWDLDKDSVGEVTLGGNRTLNNPTNMKDGNTYILTVKQDATGGRTLTYGSDYRWEDGIAPVLSTGTNAIDKLVFITDGLKMDGVIRQDFS